MVAIGRSPQSVQKWAATNMPVRAGCYRFARAAHLGFSPNGPLAFLAIRHAFMG
jgi:hypothetical protein